MNKKILLHSIVFSPDGVSTAYLYNDIALKFADSGFEVVVLTTTPHYNLVDEELAKQPLNAKWGGLFYESQYQNIRVLHVPQRKHKSAILRIRGFMYWHLISLILGLSLKNLSLILSPSPPLSIGLISIIIGKLKRAKVIYNVQEIYPDFLINKGSLKFKPAIYFLKVLERFVYNHSHAVSTIDTIFYDTIKDRFKDKSKLKVIPNFVDTEIFKPLLLEPTNLDIDLFPPKKNLFKLMYAGNIGHAQDWAPLIEVAKKLKSLPVEFLVIGEGILKLELEEDIKLNNLNNIRLLPYQARQYMPGLIAYADIHFIFMSPQMDGQGFPSKVYTIMACGKPLLVTSAKNTPLNNFLKYADSSILIEADNFDEKCNLVIKNIKEMISDRGEIKRLGMNGLKIIEKHYSKESVTSKYIQLSKDVLEHA